MKITVQHIFFIVLLLFLSTKCLYGFQDTTKVTHKKYTVGFTPTALVNRLPGLQLTQSYRVLPWISLDLESVFSFGLFTFNPRFVKNFGYRLRPGLKIHLNPKNTAHEFSFRILAHFRDVTLQYEDEDVPMANGAYTQTIRGKIDSQLTGYGFNVDYHANEIKYHVHIGLGFITGYQITEYSSDLIPSRNHFFIQNLITPGRKRAYIPFMYVHFLY